MQSVLGERLVGLASRLFVLEDEHKSTALGEGALPALEVRHP